MVSCSLLRRLRAWICLRVPPTPAKSYQVASLPTAVWPLQELLGREADEETASSRTCGICLVSSRAHPFPFSEDRRLACC